MSEMFKSVAAAIDRQQEHRRMFGNRGIPEAADLARVAIEAVGRAFDSEMQKSKFAEDRHAIGVAIEILDEALK